MAGRRPGTGEYPLDPETEPVRFGGFEIPYRAAPYFTVKKTVEYSEEEDAPRQKKGGDTEDLYNDDYFECEGEPEPRGLGTDEQHEVEGPALKDDVEYDAKKKIWFKLFHVPSMLHGAIIGPGGSTLKAIQTELDCKVTVPRRGTEGPIEVVSYKCSSGVQRAVERIELLVIDSRARKPYTHFVSIPANQEKIMKKYKELRDKVLSSDHFSEDCRNREIWCKPNKLHLTVAMLCVLDKQEERLAEEALDKAVDEGRERLPKGKHLKVRIRGLDIMGDDPYNTAVLYGKARCDKLQAFVDGLAISMRKAGFAVQKKLSDQGPVKLHMTIANVRHSEGTRRHIHAFDATGILKECGLHDFGELTFDKVVINVLGKETPGGGYAVLYEKTVPLA
uniref:KH domain-containing protein n=1 Tax=Steinernema glaseri TaxID=37863 RepID=A0A1I7ZGJ0_9BILA